MVNADHAAGLAVCTANETAHSYHEGATMTIADKVFVVTGAGNGIGKQLALALLARGAHVAAVDLRPESLQALDHHDHLSPHAIDITNREAVSALPEQVIATHGQVDGLINCAGIIQPFAKINDLDFSDIERVMNVNFYGTLAMTKAFVPHLLTRPDASLVNVSSMGGFLPVPGQGVYGASKAAVKLLTEALYAELLGTNVHVSVVFPGATATDITKNSGVAMPKIDDASTSSIPMLPADRAASLIIRGIERNQPHIFTGRDSRLMNLLYRLSPVFATKLIAKQMQSLLH